MQPTFDLVGAVADEIERRLRPLLTRPEKRLLTVEEAGAYLARTPGAIRMMRQTGKLRAVKTDGRVLFDVRDLDQVIEAAKEGK